MAFQRHTRQQSLLGVLRSNSLVTPAVVLYLHSREGKIMKSLRDTLSVNQIILLLLVAEVGLNFFIIERVPCASNSPSSSNL